MSKPLPLVYSCSGCSSAAQMANHLALRLDRAGAAEMSCIAGVGGGVAAVCPEQYSVAAWSPALNAKGNSVRGIAALELLTTYTASSIF